MTPATWNELLVKGDRFERVIWFEAPDGSIIDLEGYTVAGQVRRYASASGDPLATYACTVVDHPSPPDDMSDPSHRAVRIVIDAASSATLPAGRCVHDLVVTPPEGEPLTHLSGILTVKERVTR